MVGEPTVSGGFDGISVLGMHTGSAGRQGAVQGMFPHCQRLLPTPLPLTIPSPATPALKSLCVFSEKFKPPGDLERSLTFKRSGEPLKDWGR